MKQYLTLISIGAVLCAGACAPVEVTGPPPPSAIVVAEEDRPFYIHGPEYIVEGHPWVWVGGHWVVRAHKRVWVHGHYVRKHVG